VQPYLEYPNNKLCAGASHCAHCVEVWHHHCGAESYISFYTCCDV